MIFTVSCSSNYVDHPSSIDLERSSNSTYWERRQLSGQNLWGERWLIQDCTLLHDTSDSSKEPISVYQFCKFISCFMFSQMLNFQFLITSTFWFLPSLLWKKSFVQSISKNDSQEPLTTEVVDTSEERIGGIVSVLANRGLADVYNRVLCPTCIVQIIFINTMLVRTQILYKTDSCHSHFSSQLSWYSGQQ